jgi:two-component system chemotaxis sensor kinase CheA
VFGGTESPAEREHVVVVQYGSRRAGLTVDALLGESQTVIKPLGRVFEGLPGISGGAVLGNGRVALILDVPGLLRDALARGNDREAAPAGVGSDQGTKPF